MKSGTWGQYLCNEIQPRINFVKAATLICIRKSTRSNFEVLLGQNQVVNYLRSSPDQEVFMRYPGEWKLPGGVLEDSDYTLKHTAVRELNEEFIGLNLNVSDVKLHLFNTKPTKPIKNKRYLMHNFISFEEDNIWMNNNNIVDVINNNLTEKMKTFESQIQDKSFWSLSKEDKELVSPEVRRVQWIDLDKAIQIMSSSMTTPIQFVDDWQQQEFIKHSIERRDPMYQTMVTFQEVREMLSNKI